MTFESPSAGPRRRGIFIIGSASAVFVALVALIAWSRRTEPPRPASGPPTPNDLWLRISEGDFEDLAADASRPRIRLRAATRGTRGDTVKVLGLRRREEIRLTPGTRISVDIDWNGQANGSGLTAGIVLAPEVTSGNPLKLPSGFWVEYAGVPPGRNARRTIGVREASRHRHLDTDGWPDRNREGRPITVQRIEIEIGADRAVRVLENGREVLATGPGTLPFDRAYLYLQMTSRSNYPPREIYFDNLVVQNR